MRKVAKIGPAILIPGVTCILCFLIACFFHTSLFGGATSVGLLVKTLVTVTLISLALSINLSTGRFDFSLGSMALFASAVAGKLSMTYQLNPWILTAISLLMGLVLGGISGQIYVTLRIPPIISSLGVTLLFEGAAFMCTGGESVSVTTRSDIIAFANIPNLFILLIVCTSAVIYLTNYTRFGAEYRALKSGQSIAVDMGINEKTNAVICYIISGGLMGVVGAINLAYTGTVRMSLNFASINLMFVAFLPMFIGGYLARYINENIGIVLGSLTTAMISLLFVRVNASSAIQSVINAIILVLFLIYLNNEKLIKKAFQGIAKGGSQNI